MAVVGIVGMIPGPIGMAANLVGAGIAIYQGNYVVAGIMVGAAIIPGLGGILGKVVGRGAARAAEVAEEIGAVEGVATKGGAGAARAEATAAEVVGRRGTPIEIQPGRNAPGNAGGRDYTGHAFDRMQGRGQTPSVVENTIQTGKTTSGSTPGTTMYSDPVNGTTVITDTATGRVITVW